MVCGCLPIVKGLFPSAASSRRRHELGRARLVDDDHKKPRAFGSFPDYVRMDTLGGSASRGAVIESGDHLHEGVEAPANVILAKTRVEVV